MIIIVLIAVKKIGKKYLKNLSKYLGIIPHRKHKNVKHCLVKKLKKKKLNKK